MKAGAAVVGAGVLLEEEVVLVETVVAGFDEETGATELDELALDH